ncbi:MAG: choice-of-anchor J domain-containing protein [Bacteroidales bacterium]|nr:choice-of-anchor J domain-containing protein [Bacteroidales bacterium]
MKKFTLLLIVMMLVAFGVKAQIPLFSEDFEGGTLPNGWTIVDANSDGFNWRHSSEILGPGYGHNASDYCMFSQSYDVTYGVLFPDNWLITPAIALTEGATLSFFVCGHDDEYAAEHYGVYISTTNTEISSFTLLNQWTIGSTRDQSPWEEKMVDLSEYAGQTVYIAFRHFNVSNEFYLDLDDVTIWGYSTEPTLQANPATLAFGNALLGHNSAAQTVSVIAANLTTAITATTSAPFEVSADGNTFGSSATLPINGGNLYVRYSPSVSGNENGIVTLSSTGVNDVMVYVSGTGLDCDNIILPLSESFENEDALVCWSIIYTANQPTLSTTYASAGSSSFRFSSMSTATDYNQYLITPEYGYF